MAGSRTGTRGDDAGHARGLRAGHPRAAKERCEPPDPAVVARRGIRGRPAPGLRRGGDRRVRRRRSPGSASRWGCCGRSPWRSPARQADGGGRGRSGRGERRRTSFRPGARRSARISPSSGRATLSPPRLSGGSAACSASAIDAAASVATGGGRLGRAGRAARQDLEDAYWKSVSGEVVRLTGQALESARRSRRRDAATLQSAEAVVQATCPKRRPPVAPTARDAPAALVELYQARRPAPGASGDEGPALEPLYHALRLAEGDADRETETRHSLAQALEAMARGRRTRSTERLRVGRPGRRGGGGAGAVPAPSTAGSPRAYRRRSWRARSTTRQHVMALIAQADAR